jgi:hypothetical protein
MKIKFLDIQDGAFRAKVSEIKEGDGIYGPYLRIVFTIIEKGTLNHYTFAGIVKCIPLKQSKFFRWVTTILGEPPDDSFSVNELLGKECIIAIAKKDTYYSVIDVFRKPDM